MIRFQEGIRTWRKIIDLLIDLDIFLTSAVIRGLNTAAIGIALAYMGEVTSIIDTHLKSTGWSNIFNVERSPRAVTFTSFMFLPLITSAHPLYC